MREIIWPCQINGSSCRFTGDIAFCIHHGLVASPAIASRVQAPQGNNLSSTGVAASIRQLVARPCRQVRAAMATAETSHAQDHLPHSKSPALEFQVNSCFINRPCRRPGTGEQGRSNLQVVAQQGRARTAQMTLPHFTAETPMFMPVGTQGAALCLCHYREVVRVSCNVGAQAVCVT